MKIAKLLLAASTVVALSSSMSAFAQNNSAANASGMAVNEPWRLQYLSSSGGTSVPYAWYWTTVYAGRSYCAETTYYQYETQETDTGVYIYAADGTGLVGGGDDKDEPGNFVGHGKAFGPSRYCFIATATGYVHILSYLYSNGRNVATRIVETTLYNPWYFRVASTGYDAFATLTNTTSSAVNFVLRARNSAGTIVGTHSGALPANGGTVVAVSSMISGDGDGSWELAHNGSPGAIAAGQTTMSSSTGLSFDTQFLPRTSRSN